MEITIIGATRGIGKEALKQAVTRFQKVTVLARDPAKIEMQNDNLNIVEGDFIKYDSVKDAIKNADVIVISVGCVPSRKPVTLFSVGAGHIIKAIDELKINPLVIAVTGIGAGDSEGHGSFLYNKVIKPLLLKTIYDDKNRQEEILKKECKKWIIVRPGFLKNGGKTGRYNIYTTLDGVKAGKISRADVADFILKQAENPTYLMKTPLITT
ncbi:MAG: SDR family oxidoreductase [Chlorobi bacterium]|nr:SDR family oxidoreductase [Chlorobiota bacterium]